MTDPPDSQASGNPRPDLKPAVLNERPFEPPFYLRNRFVQTTLGSLRLRSFKKSPVLAAARKIILKTNQGTRLLGALSRKADAPSKGMVILLHGWEGSIDSTYVRNAAHFLFDRGFDIFRLNLRDHGDSHGLNPGIFYATLIEETTEAVAQAAGLADGAPVYLCGFSLGGNFALRIARSWPASNSADIELRHVVAVSPVLDPSRATDAVDSHRMIRNYFLRKWHRSLILKQRLFPELYDFQPMLRLRTVRSMTEALLQASGIYENAQAYFNEYTLCGNALAGIKTDTTLVTAADDPIIPVDDFHGLALPPCVRVIVHDRGGHNGFLMGFDWRRWHESFMEALFTP